MHIYMYIHITFAMLNGHQDRILCIYTCHTRLKVLFESFTITPKLFQNVILYFSQSVQTGWQRCIGYLIFIGYFPQKSH